MSYTYELYPNFPNAKNSIERRLYQYKEFKIDDELEVEIQKLKTEKKTKGRYQWIHYNDSYPVHNVQSTSNQDVQSTGEQDVQSNINIRNKIVRNKIVNNYVDELDKQRPEEYEELRHKAKEVMEYWISKGFVINESRIEDLYRKIIAIFLHKFFCCIEEFSDMPRLSMASS